ncbi:hypothetical protein PAV_4c06630 [Paenibacillus alvei DSM 29]|nr:hypothetical protein PAV_4c06630 [Paenibacillus alvei DSM 29]
MQDDRIRTSFSLYKNKTLTHIPQLLKPRCTENSNLSHLGFNYVHGTFLFFHTSKRSRNANMKARRRKECHGTRITAKFSFKRVAAG